MGKRCGSQQSFGSVTCFDYFFSRFEDFVRKEQKNVNPDEEVMADSSEMKLKQVRL